MEHPVSMEGLDHIGDIQGVEIPDVTLRGRSALRTTRHAVHEASELSDEVYAYVAAQDRNPGLKSQPIRERAARRLLRENIDLAIISLSAINLWKRELGEDIVQEEIRNVLLKNKDRGYYEPGTDMHADDCDSASAAMLRAAHE